MLFRFQKATPNISEGPIVAPSLSSKVPLQNLTLSPLLALKTQFHSRTSPVLTMVMHMTIPKPSTLQSLLLRQNSKQAKDNRDTRIKLHTHESLADGVGDVFEVHGCALDEHADGDDRIEGFLRAGEVGRAGYFGCWRGQEVRGAGALRGGGVGLELGCGVEAGCQVVLVNAITGRYSKHTAHSTTAHSIQYTIKYAVVYSIQCHV